MDMNTKRKEKREKLVISMAQKLAIGNGVKQITAFKRNKKYRKLLYISAGVLFFLISSLIIYLHIPKQIIVTPEMLQKIQAQKNPLNLIYADFQQKKISPDEYALYLKDLLTRYDSLPQNYRIDIPYIKSSEVYDSLISVWPHVNIRIRISIQKLLPKIEQRLREKQIYSSE